MQVRIRALGTVGPNRFIPPAFPRLRLVGLVTLGALLLMGAEAARQVAQGSGPLRDLARDIYRSARARIGGYPVAFNAPVERAEAPLPVYDDHLSPGWQDWSWAVHRLDASSRVKSGKHAISMIVEGFKGVYLHHDALNTAGYGSLEVHLSGEASLNVSAANASKELGRGVPIYPYLKTDPKLPAGWRVARIPLRDLGVPPGGATLTGFAFQASTAERRGEAFLDAISLLPDSALPAAPNSATVKVMVDVTADQREISPLIYGMAFADPATLSDLRLGSNRWGGNDKSRYNWEHGNACSAARDWNWANKIALEGDFPPGPSSAVDFFIGRNRAAGCETVLTLPTLGWVARNAENATRSVNVPDGGSDPLAGPDGPIAGYDPAENRRRTSIRSLARRNNVGSEKPDLQDNVVYQDQWVQHLVRKWGSARNGGVRLYAMDNEPDLWDHTHTDVHPARMSYDDLLARFLEYATAVKAMDPSAEVTGPVSWGWTGYFYSPLDRGADNYRTAADRKRHGGDPFLRWFLNKVREHDTKAGKRTLDVLDVHYYPQGQNLYGSDVQKDTQARRLRAVRSLWDSSYPDESWVGEPVRLIPRLKEWISQGYPGTKIGITEWSFGADHHINGALAIAETLGVFGREGVYLANYWAYPGKGTPGYLAFKLFRNPDGQGRGFGDLSCRAVSGAPDQVSAFAAVDRKTSALTLLLINKLPSATATVPLTLHNAGAERMGRFWRLSGEKTARLEPGEPIVLKGGAATLSLPPSSVTLVRFSSGEGARE